MSRTVVISAMCSQYPEDKPPGTEIWTVNRAHTMEPRTDRAYFFDPHTLFHDGFIEEMAGLNVPVFTREPLPGIPLSEAFPVDDIVRFFGIEYSTSTVAWMIQHAIYEHCHGDTIDQLVLNGMYHPRDSVEYLWALPCVNFWVGVAMGHGMKVRCYGFNAVVRAMPWESNRYGYRRNTNADLCVATLSAAYKACYEYPRTFKNAEDEICPTEDRESLVLTKRRLEGMLKQVNDALEPQLQ